MVLFGSKNISAQIGIDTVSQYSGTFVPSVMLTDSSGNILVGGNGSDLPVMAKFNPDSGLSWAYSYAIAEGDEGQVFAMTVDSLGNIYSYIHSQFTNHWVQKFSSEGAPINIYDSLLGETFISIQPFGHIEVSADNYIQLFTEKSAGQEVVIYTFDTSLSTLIDSVTYQIQSAVSCCYEPVLSSPGELIFNGVENDVQGVYQIENNQIDHHPFIGHQFDDLDYSLLSKWNNQYFVYSDNEVLTGDNDTFSINNPEIVLFNENWEYQNSVFPFSDTIQNSSTVVRPYVRDALLHPEYGIILCGQYSSGVVTPREISEFIIQVDPVSLQVVNKYVNTESRFFTHLTQFDDQVYALDRPIGYPSGMNLLKLNLDKVVGLAEVSTKSKGFQVNIYPNPTTGSIQIESETAIEKVEVYDLSGRVVLDKTQLSTRSIQIEQPGTYIVRLYTSDEVLIQKVLVTK